MLEDRRGIDFKWLRTSAAFAFALTGVLAFHGCSSDDSAAPGADGGTTATTGAGGGGNCPPGGGPIMETAPDTCMGMFQTVGDCSMEPPSPDAGPPEDLPGPTNGTEKDDDDCKYHVAFTNDCVRTGGTGTTFTVTLTSLTKNMAKVPGATPYIEGFVGNRPIEGDTKGKETSTPGVYTIGPVIFPVSGKWTVRFHFFGDCSDEPKDSPHAHAAFFINVP